MKRENRTAILFLITSVIVPILFILLFLHDNVKLEKISLDGIIQVNNVTEYGIEAANITNGSILLKGWLLETPDTIYRVDRNFILSDGNNVYQLNTIMQTRNDITERWNNGNNYDNSGLEGNGTVAHLEKGRYQIGFLMNYNSEKHYYLTAEYLEVY